MPIIKLTTPKGQKIENLEHFRQIYQELEDFLNLSLFLGLSAQELRNYKFNPNTLDTSYMVHSEILNIHYQETELLLICLGLGLQEHVAFLRQAHFLSVSAPPLLAALETIDDMNQELESLKHRVRQLEQEQLLQKPILEKILLNAHQIEKIIEPFHRKSLHIHNHAENGNKKSTKFSRSNSIQKICELLHEVNKDSFATLTGEQIFTSLSHKKKALFHEAFNFFQFNGFKSNFFIIVPRENYFFILGAGKKEVCYLANNSSANNRIILALSAYMHALQYNAQPQIEILNADEITLDKEQTDQIALIIENHYPNCHSSFKGFSLFSSTEKIKDLWSKIHKSKKLTMAALFDMFADNPAFNDSRKIDKGSNKEQAIANIGIYCRESIFNLFLAKKSLSLDLIEDDPEFHMEFAPQKKH